MTERKHFKKRVRARMTKTGESYTTARDQIVAQAVPAEELDPAYLKEITGVTNEAVEKKTGRNWNQWIALLDAARADRLKHPEIAKLLHERQGVPGWWAQMVTGGYERVRGMRAVNEKGDGFSVNKSKTLAVPVSRLFSAWDDETKRRAWLNEDLTVRKSTPQKSMRITWSDGSHVDVYFNAKGDSKSQVSLQHSKLADAPQAQSCRAMWTQKLEGLKQFLAE